MQFPIEIWEHISHFTDSTILFKFVILNKFIFNHCDRIQFWINKFNFNNFTIFNNPKTINDYVRQYIDMIDAKKAVEIIIKIADIEREYDKDYQHDPNLENKSNGDIIILWEGPYSEHDENDDIFIPKEMIIARDDHILDIKRETGEEIKYFPSNIIISYQSDDQYDVKLEMYSMNMGEGTIVRIMTLAEIKKLLIDAQYTTKVKLTNISICDKEEQPYYYDSKNIDENIDDISQYDYFYIKKFFSRLGIRKALQYQNK